MYGKDLRNILEITSKFNGLINFSFISYILNEKRIIMWEQVCLPAYITERFIGVSQPIDDNLAIISYDGIHLLNINEPGNISLDKRFPEGAKIFDSKNNILTYKDKIYKVMGLYGGQTIEVNKIEERILTDKESETLKIIDCSGNEVFQYHYVDISGDWIICTFSEDSKYAILCLPNDLYLFKRT